MAGTMQQTCALCFHFDKGNSYCRKEAPTAQIINNKPTTIWPVVLPTDWCGYFDPRRPPGS